MSSIPRFCYVFFFLSTTTALADDSTADSASHPEAKATQVSFERDVAPILRDRCISCHGPSMQLAELRLDEKKLAFAGGESGGPIEPGDVDGSYLIDRLHDEDLGLIMPPTGALSAQEVATLRNWIEQGAAWPDDLQLVPDSDAKEDNPKFRVLYFAIRAADHNAIHRALTDDPELVNVTDRHGATPLMYASLYASAKSIQLLLDHGANPNHADNHGATALMWAAGDFEKVKLLLKHNADVNARSKLDRTPLMIASSFAGNVRTVETLLALSSDNPREKYDALKLAAYTGDTEIAGVLLKANGSSYPVRGPIRTAAFVNDLPMLKLMVEHGERGPVLTDALVNAAFNGSLPAVQVLLDAGADINAKDRVTIRTSPDSALAAAVYSERQSEGSAIIRLLLRNGADPSLFDARDRTAFDYAAQRARTELGDLMTGRESRVDRSVREAAEKGIALLQSCGTSFYRRSGCVACHQHTVTSLALEQARRTGVPYDEEAAQEQLKLTAIVNAQRRPRFLQRIVTGGAAHTIGYLLLGMAAEGYPADEITDAAVIEVSGLQMADGGWFSHAHRPPSEYARISATAVGVRSMKLYAPPGLRDTFEKRYQAARDWLLASTAELNQEYAFRLLGLKWTGANGSAIQQAKADLLKQQQSDGGWSQRPEMRSDAYATGLALYALHVGGDLPTIDAAYQRGVQFLLARQLPDGSWHVHSRSYPLQPYFESGFPHHHDQWISAAATGWAATSLLLSLEEK